MLRFLAGLLLFLLACMLQFWCTWAGITVNFILAGIMALAFLFGFWETVVFALLAVFLSNWQPAASREMALFIILPVGAYLFHKFSHWEAWIGVLISIVVGLAIFYLSVAPAFFVAHFLVFCADLLSCLIFGGLVFHALDRRVGR